ncbi:hypothetical protein EGW08_017288 [Elysia chlorotica]|uniref:CUB domain-containing protein n=1 Tax=Elysia chlorotica TaxID=188477 RepID=A0A3S0ZHE5_ELYCH|nr:hypothetical protein EGW08_017288 [Elysia chlorotica]
MEGRGASVAPNLLAVVTVVLHSLVTLTGVTAQTKRIPMRSPSCNTFFREVPAAFVEGAAGAEMGADVCDVTLSRRPSRSVWLLRLERAVILDCGVFIQVFDSHFNPANRKPVLTHRCADPDPGVLQINSTTLTIRLKHNNSSDYSFTIVVTSARRLTSSEADCAGFKCKNNLCIPKSLLCDKVDNCFDHSDESPNGTSHCQGVWPFQRENWGVLASVLGAAVVFGGAYACCRHIRRSKRKDTFDDLYEFHEGPYVHKYAYHYAVIRPPKRPNKTNVVLGRDGHMHYNTTSV